MTKQSLYILAFKDEAVIKVGLAIDPWLRIAALGSARFDLGASYLVQCRDKSAVRTLERMLKTFFNDHRVTPEKELSSGNTETFHASILPEMLQAIEKLSSIFPGSELKIQSDLSSIAPVRAGASKNGADHAKRVWQRLYAKRVSQRLYEQIDRSRNGL